LKGRRPIFIVEKHAGRAYRCRIFCSRLRRRIRFLRHFQRIFPRFFHAREERFIGRPARVFDVFLSSFS
jgi:hypothetical protein